MADAGTGAGDGSWMLAQLSPWSSANADRNTSASLRHKGRLPDPLATRLIGRRPLITFITLGELTKWAEIRH
jgi:hypothetical protein